MSSTRRSPYLSRFTLPVICLALAAATWRWGAAVLADATNGRRFGPLLPNQASPLLCASFGTLAAITLLLAFLPGNDAAQDDDDIDEALFARDEDTAVHEGDGEQSPAATSEEIDALTCASVQAVVATTAGDAPVDKATTGAIAAFKRLAANQTRARIAAEERLAATQEQITALQDALDGLREGTSPEGEALRTQIAEDARRDALGQVQAITEAADRVQVSLRGDRDRAVAAAAALEESLQAVHQAREADQAAVAAQIEAARAEMAVQIAEATAQAAAAERDRLRVAVTAINSTEIDVLDHLQREAVRRHTQRITAAIDRLDPTQPPTHGPALAVPPLTPATPPTNADAATEPAVLDAVPVRRRRSALSRLVSH